MTTRYGIYLPLFDPFGHPRVIADLARDAEAAGWDGVFTWDESPEAGCLPAPACAAAAHPDLDCRNLAAQASPGAHVALGWHVSALLGH